MNSRNPSLHRRKFLRGAGGAALALPILEIQGATAVSQPKRLVAAGVFYGLVPNHFHPEEVGAGYKTPKLLKPLEHLRKDFTVFSGLDHNIGGGHNATRCFLNGIPTNQAKGFEESNISVDQKAAQHVGSATRFPSLALGCEAHPTNYLSWTPNGSQIQPTDTVAGLYSKLFLNPSEKQRGTERTRFSQRSSVLDLVQDQAKAYARGLGKVDGEKLERYFTSVRELEVQIEQAESWLDHPKPKTNFPQPEGIDDLTLADKVPIFYDLMALALETDSTRCITLSFTELGKDGGGIPGVNSGYHSLSHHGKVQEVIDELTLIETFHTTQFARFLDRLKATSLPDGSNLLDHTMGLFGSGMSNANSHSNRDLPVLLAGGGFRHGEHKHYARNGKQSVPLNNLFLSMLQNFGLEIDKFNTSTGTLSGLEYA